LIYQAMIKTS